MRKFALSLALVVALGTLALTPSRADATWPRRAYYPSYYSYGYAPYAYSVPSYYGTYSYPSWNSYYRGNVRYVNPGINTFSYYGPGVTYVPQPYLYSPLPGGVYAPY